VSALLLPASKIVRLYLEKGVNKRSLRFCLLLGCLFIYVIATINLSKMSIWSEKKCNTIVSLQTNRVPIYYSDPEEAKLVSASYLGQFLRGDRFLPDTKQLNGVGWLDNDFSYLVGSLYIVECTSGTVVDKFPGNIWAIFLNYETAKGTTNQCDMVSYICNPNIEFLFAFCRQKLAENFYEQNRALNRYKLFGHDRALLAGLATRNNNRDQTYSCGSHEGIGANTLPKMVAAILGTIFIVGGFKCGDRAVKASNNFFGLFICLGIMSIVMGGMLIYTVFDSDNGFYKFIKSSYIHDISNVAEADGLAPNRLHHGQEETRRKGTPA
jgi:hypothetical protein